MLAEHSCTKQKPTRFTWHTEAMMNSSQEWERRIATFSIEDLLQVCSIFYGDAWKKKSGPVSEINYKSSIHLSEAVEETQFHPYIMCKPSFCPNLWVNIERMIGSLDDL